MNAMNGMDTIYCTCKAVRSKIVKGHDTDCPIFVYYNRDRTQEALDRKETVDHPPHCTRGGFEAIDVIEAWELGFNTGNAVKYLSRAGHKDPSKTVEDLKKSRWYIDREIQRLEKAKAK